MTEIREDIRQRDSIDFAQGDVRQLFRKMFVPTLLGMVSMVLLNLADGAFVGHGAGTEALAAINIAAPVFNLMTGIGIMFGIGVSVVASIHLSRGNVKAARINCTQALLGSFILCVSLSVLILTHLPQTCRLFGSNEALIPLAGSYLRWVAAFMPFSMLGMVGEFIVRLDGSPKYAMSCTLVASVLNIFLDWLLIFPLGMGLEGAAIATSISFTVSAGILFIYLIFKSETLKLYALKLSRKSLALSLRNLWYQMKAGASSMLGEVSISGSMIIGNFIFIKYLGEDGVAAFSVACYCMPVIFMISNAIVQSVQPITSFAHGVGDSKRKRESLMIAVRSALWTGLGATLMFTLGAPLLCGMFIDPGEQAFSLCTGGMPYFGSGCLLISINLVLVGYLQSIEKSGLATLYTILRGFVLVIPAFILLPKVLGVPGIWLATPVAEGLTLLIMSILIWRRS